MSEECCGPDDARPSPLVRRVEMTRPARSGDACHGPDVTDAHRDVVVDVGDACCGPDVVARAAGPEMPDELRGAWWRDMALLPSRCLECSFSSATCSSGAGCT